MEKEKRLQDPTGKIELTARRVRDGSGIATLGLLVLGAVPLALGVGAITLGANELYKSEHESRTGSNKIIKDNREQK